MRNIIVFIFSSTPSFTRKFSTVFASDGSLESQYQLDKRLGDNVIGIEPMEKEGKDNTINLWKYLQMFRKSHNQ